MTAALLFLEADGARRLWFPRPPSSALRRCLRAAGWRYLRGGAWGPLTALTEIPSLVSVARDPSCATPQRRPRFGDGVLDALARAKAVLRTHMKSAR